MDIPQSAVWYIRSALGGALLDKVRFLETADKALADPTLAELFRDSWEGMQSHYRQWLREGLEEFSNLPAEIRPSEMTLEKAREALAR